MNNNIDSMRNDFLTGYPGSVDGLSDNAKDLALVKGSHFFLNFLQSPGIDNLMTQTMTSPVSSTADREGYLLAYNTRNLLIPSLVYFLGQQHHVPGAYKNFEEIVSNLISSNNSLIDSVNHQIDIEKTLEGARKILSMALRRPENFQDFGYKENDIGDLLKVLNATLQKVNAWR